jgi:hypothetical protein
MGTRRNLHTVLRTTLTGDRGKQLLLGKEDHESFRHWLTLGTISRYLAESMCSRILGAACRQVSK